MRLGSQVVLTSNFSTLPEETDIFSTPCGLDMVRLEPRPRFPGFFPSDSPALLEPQPQPLFAGSGRPGMRVDGNLPTCLGAGQAVPGNMRPALSGLNIRKK